MIRLCAFADESAGSLSGQIEALKRNGISLLEVRNINGKNILSISLDEAKEYAKQLSENGIKVWSIGSPLGKIDIDVDFEEYKGNIRHICELAKIFECENIRMFSFFKAYDEKEKVFKYLQEMVDIGNSYGLKMCHENEKEIYGDNLSRTVEVLDNVKGIYSIYDPANFLQTNEKSADTIEALFDRTYYFHIKDVIVNTGELVPAGYGDGDIDKIVSKINDDKVLTLEPHLAVFAGYADIDNTQMKNKFKFTSNEEAFDAAVKALKGILVKNGYKEDKEGFIK